VSLQKIAKTYLPFVSSRNAVGLVIKGKTAHSKTKWAANLEPAVVMDPIISTVTRQPDSWPMPFTCMSLNLY